MNYAVNFEDIVLEELKKLCGDETAGKVMETYRPVIQLLQDSHDSAKVQAERYYREYNAGTSSKDWVQHIIKTRKKYGTIETSTIEIKSASSKIPPNARRTQDREHQRQAAYGSRMNNKPNRKDGSRPPGVVIGRGKLVPSTKTNKIVISVGQQELLVSKGVSLATKGIRSSTHGPKKGGAQFEQQTNGHWKKRDSSTGRFVDVKGNSMKSKPQTAGKILKGKREGKD